MTALDITDVEIVDAELADDPEPSLAEHMAAGLRQLADMIEANPEQADLYEFALGRITAPLSRRSDKKGALATAVRAAKRHGARIEKYYTDGEQAQAGAVLCFGPNVKVKMITWREEICTRVVTGTQTIVKSIPDPAAVATLPLIEVEETVETATWICEPLLAEAETRKQVTA